ncbi:hypothetical protein NE237_031937 [Protea cynaroides]|uniref:MYND-type domain-containing protein n=1 Tax=Protea cynaroides TaxID=273540 RepID=A0A9Q0R2L5_9MAGN|nr:hypothetical protein NE237_031937 [Protea cynaroides]
MDVHLNNLFARFQQQFGSGPGLGPGSGTCLLKIDGIAPAFIKSLFKASAALYRTDPWKRLRPRHLFGVRVGKNSDWTGKKQPFPCAQFIGGEGGDLSFHMFRSQLDALKMTGSRETIRVPNVEVLRVSYELESLMFPSNRKMIKSLSLEVSGTDRFPVIDVAHCTSMGELQFRSPTLEELRFVFAFIKAVALVHPLLQQDKEATPKWSRLMVFEPFIETVDVQWPPEMAKGWDQVAVTISHPPGQAYEEKANSTASSTPTKYTEPPKEEVVDLKTNWAAGLRQCAMCEKEVNGDQSFCCNWCRAIVYCDPVCQKQHWKETHKGLCGLYKAMMERKEELAMKIFMFPCSAKEHPCKWLEFLGLHQKGMWRRKCNCYSHCPFDSWSNLDDEEYPRDSPFPNHLRDGISSPILLSGWSEYYNLRSLPFSSPVAVILSHPLTVYYILTTLSKSSKNLLLKGKEVVLHYLGPEGELDWMAAFAEIGHLLNGLGNIQVVMVGPDKFVGDNEAAYLPSPDIVIALNCGLESYPSWSGALDLIKSKNIPAFFTDQSKISWSNAKQVVRGAGLHITHPLTPIPFRSPVRNQEPSSNLPSYSNGFVLGVNT